MLEGLRRLLQAERHSVDCVSTADDGMRFLETYEYDALVVDWEMPGMSGVELIRRYRAGGGNAPVLMLTGKSATSEKVTGLDSGADYYLTKPFDAPVLLSFLRASLRRSPEIQQSSYSVAGLELREASSEACFARQCVNLTAKEVAVLKLLIQHQDRIISHEELKSHGWPGEGDVSGGSIRVFLTALREKLQSVGAPVRILSVRGYGYRLEAN